MSVLTRDQFLANVISNTQLCREHYRLTLRLDQFPSTQPGQFIQIACSDFLNVEEPARTVEWIEGGWPEVGGIGLAGPEAVLRRPFSLAGRRDLPGGGVELDIIHRVVGIGTDWLSQLEVGGEISILGPLGNTFRLPAAGETAILVGGGVGIPPMLYLATKLVGRKAIAFVGALTQDLLPITLSGETVEEFARHGVESNISTDDGSVGFRGFVTQSLEKYLDETQPNSAIIYTCGPELMMKRVAAIAAERHIECQVAVERAMACGMGTCQSCCIRVKKPDPAQPPLVGKDWCYRLACTDGPVFRGEDLLW